MNREKSLVIAELRDCLQDMVASKRELARLIVAHADDLEKHMDEQIAVSDAGNVEKAFELSANAMKIQKHIGLVKMKNNELEQKMQRLALEMVML